MKNVFFRMALGALALSAAAGGALAVDADVAASRVAELTRLSTENPTETATVLKLAAVLRGLGRSDEADKWTALAQETNPERYAELTTFVVDRGVSDCNPPTTGPDVIVGELSDLSHYTSTGAVGGIRAYAVGTTSCNIGTVNALWDDETSDGTPSNRHPVIAQNMYRLKNGRFEQIGQSWLKHGFTALTGSLCCSCNGQGGNVLGVGCSDPYGSSLNGSYSWLGPKHEVNPSTGVYPHPYGSFPNSSPIGKRLQVQDTDLDPALNAGAFYWVEGHYVTTDEPAWNNGLNSVNNASHRRISVASNRGIAFVSGQPTVRTLPAIYGWRTVDPQVTIQTIDVPSDGRFTLGHRVYDNGNGTWTYEYAMHNLNSDRAGQSFSVPVPTGVTVTNIGFRDCDWHSGAPYSNVDWTSSQAGGQISWAGQTFAQNQNANALRWSTLYNFRFTANYPPVPGNVTLGLFKPGTPNSIAFAGAVPSGPAPCPADLDGDGQVGASDLAALLGSWGAGGPADFDGGGVSASDLAVLLGSWGPCN